MASIEEEARELAKKDNSIPWDQLSKTAKLWYYAKVKANRQEAIDAEEDE